MKLEAEDKKTRLRTAESHKKENSQEKKLPKKTAQAADGNYIVQMTDQNKDSRACI